MSEFNSKTEGQGLSEESRGRLKSLSGVMLRLHKLLLDDAKATYEAINGPIASVQVYFQLVIDDAHFAWLRKLSSLIALIDEAASVRRPATEGEVVAILGEARILFSFKDADGDFNTKFAAAISANTEGAKLHQEAITFLGEE